MSSMSNWLAFSLSQQELPNSSQTPHLISGSSYVDDPPMGIPTLRNDASFGTLEAFHRPQHQTPDWNLKSLEFKGAGSPSELSMLVGSSSSYRNHTGIYDDEEPKLEDFLGGSNSFSDHDQKVLPDYMFSNSPSSFPVQDASVVVLAHDHGAGGLIHTVGSFSGSSSGSNNNSIGLSMIKTWLRNQPAGAVSHPQRESNRITDKEMEAVAGPSSSNAGNETNAACANTPQGLSLSMSTRTQSSGVGSGGAVLPLLPVAATSRVGGGETSCSNSKQKGAGTGQLDAQTGANAIDAAISRKPVDTFGQRTSIYRGVTRHRWTGRYEAHLWDNSCRREGQTRKGRQVYLGGYDKEDKAARAYDLAALKYWGSTTTTNFPISNYEKELEEMKHMTRQELIASLRRKSSGFSRGASIYRGVTRHHQHGRWQARIGRVAGNKDLYLGTFSTQEEAAEAYDVAAIKFRGLNAVTNFDMSRYDVKSILESSTLAIGGGAAKRLKEMAAAADEDDRVEASVHGHLIRPATADDHRHLLGPGGHFDAGFGWHTIAFHQPPAQVEYSSPLALQYHPYAPPTQRGWCKQELEAAHGGHDLRQLQLGGVHNFFHQSSPANTVLHNLVSWDTPLDPGTGPCNSAIYNPGGYQGGLATPIVVTDHQGSDADSNAYYLAQHLDTDNATWMPASGPARGSRSVAGAPLFRAWNNDG